MTFTALLNSPRQPAPIPTPRAPSNPGGILDGMLAAIDGIEAEQGELGGEFARAFITGAFRKRGFPVELKSRAERELMQRESSLALEKLKDAERGRAVRETVGILLDNAKDLQGQLGTRLDSSILQRPDDLIRASQQIAQALGDESLALRHSDLLLNDLTASFAKQTAEERGADKAAQQSKAQRDLASNLEFQAELQAGEGPAAEAFGSRLEAAGESVGQDLTPGLFGDDFDEAQGSAAVTKSFLDQGESFQAQGLGPEVMIGMLLGDVGKRIGSVLRGGETQLDQDGRRVLRIGGGVFNDPQAVSNYVGLIDKVSELTGRPRSELLGLMGLPFDDFDEAEIGQARADLGL